LLTLGAYWGWGRIVILVDHQQVPPLATGSGDLLLED
jgi:hypothetical protein